MSVEIHTAERFRQEHSIKQSAPLRCAGQILGSELERVASIG